LPEAYGCWHVIYARFSRGRGRDKVHSFEDSIFCGGSSYKQNAAC
jgi:hypothetical protein